MATIDLKYGSTSLGFEYDSEALDVLRPGTSSPALSDIEINAKLDQPIDSAPLEDIVEPGQTVLIVVPDATREVGAGQIVNLLVRRLIANGSAPHEIRIIFATGIHRPVTSGEKLKILTPFIAQRINTLDHDPRDLARIVRVGETSGGIAVEFDRAVVEHDHIVLVGGVSFHYFAGFTGGRKLICPGLASSQTVKKTHRLAFDFDRKMRRTGVGTALLDGNAVHQAFDEACALVAPSFAVTTNVNESGEVAGLVCGDWRTSHRAACEAFDRENTIQIAERREFVIASCGGYPHDINLIQAHKALEAASQACVDGGTIVLVAACPDGPGHDDFMAWFDLGSSEAIADRLCESYKVNGQTAWNLRRITEHFRVVCISDLPDGVVTRAGMHPAGSLQDAVGEILIAPSGYIVPAGSRTNIVQMSENA